MKRCPECRRDYHDDTLSFCLADGSELVYGLADAEPATEILYDTDPPREAATRAQVPMPDQSTEKRSDTADAPIAKGFDKRLLLAPVALVVIVLGAFFAYRYVTQARQIESIAVMPFVNESGDAEVEYLSDGMTESLIKSLSQLPNLNVKGSSTVFRYKGKNTDTKTVGQELNVQAVLYGRVIPRGDQLTLSLELLDAETENVIWNDRYERKQGDLVTLQVEIARDVSSKLRSKLSGADEAKVTKNYTANPEAYQLYLKGRFYWNQRTPESFRRAVELFDQAIEKDPAYALAYSGLAESYVLFSNYEVDAPKDSMPKAKAAALRAIELDDSLAESHTALGMYYSKFAWDMDAAEREFRRAIELNPNYASAYQQLAVEALTPTRRFDEAVAAGKRAEEIDPLSPVISSDVGNILTRARRFDEAIKQLQKAVSQNPNFAVGWSNLGTAYHSNGNFEEAVAAYRKALALDERPFTKASLIQPLVRSGHRDEAVKLLAEIEAASSRVVVAPAALALAHGALGDKDKAFAMLEREVAERGGRAPSFAVHPMWDDLRDDPRFDALIRKVEQSKLD